MTDFDINLKVVTDHLNQLAAQQQEAANKLEGSNRLTADIANGIRDTHGLICIATATAMTKGEEARKAAGEKMFAVSTEFNEKLTTAVTNYSNVDYREGRSLGESCEV